MHEDKAGLLTTTYYGPTLSRTSPPAATALSRHPQRTTVNLNNDSADTHALVKPQVWFQWETFSNISHPNTVSLLILSSPSA